MTQPVTNRGQGHHSPPGAGDPASLDSSHQGRRGQGETSARSHQLTSSSHNITEPARRMTGGPPSLPPKTRGTPRLPPKPLDNPRHQGGHQADQRRGHTQGGHPGGQIGGFTQGGHPGGAPGVHSVSSTSAKRPLPPLPPPRVPPPPPPMPK